MENIKLGSRGENVRRLQIALKALGKAPGDVDGVFGPATLAAVRDFQDDHEELVVDGVVGPLTWGLIDQALEVIEPEPDDRPPIDSAALVCSDETWQQFQSLVALVTDANAPVRYGPGRGLWYGDRFIITHGPGRLDSKAWRSPIGRTFPSFHCSSWTNFVLGVLARRNQDFTHAGNIPGMFKLCTAANVPVTQAGVGTWRGYGDICRQFESDGSSRARTRVPDRRVIDLRELYWRREELPTFFVCAQSTRDDDRWRWWHHTILFVIDHRTAGAPMFRIAADGVHRKSSGWSGRAMAYREIDDDAVAADLGRRIYRGFAVHLPQVFDRPVAAVALEP